MNFKYFCAPKLNDILKNIPPATFEHLGETKPLAVKTSYPDLAFDFNCGMRLQIPKGNWHVKIRDFDSEIVCFEDDASDVLLVSLEKFFVRWEFTLQLDGQIVFYHLYNPKDWRVHFYFPLSGMGDRISLFPYMEAFRKKWKCNATCTVEPYLQELVNLYFPQVECIELPDDSYAAYFLSPGFNRCFYPEEIRKSSMLYNGQQIFGLQHAPKIIYRPTKPRQIKEPYVCIAVQTSATIKAWLNSDGWFQVVDYLKQFGYRVLCIDKNPTQTDHGFTVNMPVNAENFTGDFPLSERVNLLAYADFFIGSSSGLAWLAWAVDRPVILISGITAPWFEFDTPYRVLNRLVCFGCHNDINLKWGDFEHCPHHHDTERAYECQRKISARQVIQTINQLLESRK